MPVRIAGRSAVLLVSEVVVLECRKGPWKGVCGQKYHFEVDLVLYGRTDAAILTISNWFGVKCWGKSEARNVRY
jgi:hypothetical protein